MENLSRGPTFGDFVTLRTERDAGRHGCKITEYKSTESTDSSLPPLLNVMYCVRISLWTVTISLFLRNTKEKGVVSNLCISLFSSKRVPGQRKRRFHRASAGSFQPGQPHGPIQTPGKLIILETCLI